MIEEYKELTEREKEIYIAGVLMQNNERQLIKWSGNEDSIHNHNVLALFKHLGVFENWTWSFGTYKGRIYVTRINANGEVFVEEFLAGQIGTVELIRYIIDIAHNRPKRPEVTAIKADLRKL